MSKLRINDTVIVLIWCAFAPILWSLGSSFSLPSIGELLEAWGKLITEDGLLYHLWISMQLNFEVIAISTIISVGLAYLTTNRWFVPPALALSKFRFFGMVGFSVIFTRVFGGGHSLKVSMLVFIMSTFFLTSMLDVVGSATRDEYDHTRTLGMSRIRGVWEIVVRGRLDSMFDALRQNAAIGWMSLTIVEGLVRFEGGVGVLMLGNERYRNLAPIFAVQLTVLIVGIIQDEFIGWLKNIFCPHSKLVLETK
jgi:NitT/TauT family transport system permease protein